MVVHKPIGGIKFAVEVAFLAEHVSVFPEMTALLYEKAAYTMKKAFRSKENKLEAIFCKFDDDEVKTTVMSKLRCKMYGQNALSKNGGVDEKRIISSPSPVDRIPLRHQTTEKKPF